MEQARKLRERADRCIRLSRSLSNPMDVASLEAFAAESNRAAAEREFAEAARLAKQPAPVI